MDNPTNVEGGEKMSPEDVKKRRAEITKFYKEQTPHLKAQAEYERLMTEIEESRAKRLQAQAFIAQAYEAMNVPDEDTESPESDFEKATRQEITKKRKLKTT